MAEAGGNGSGYDAAVVTTSGLDGDRVRGKLEGAVGYFEQEAAALDLAAVNARSKAERLQAQAAMAEGAVVEAEQAAALYRANAEQARTALAGLGD